MSSDLAIDSDYDTYSDFVIAPSLNYCDDWNGHQIAWRDLPEAHSEMERRIIEIYNSGNHVLDYQLTTLYFQGTHPRYEIQQVMSSKGIFDSEENLKEWLKYAEEFQSRLIEEQKQVLGEVGVINPPLPLEPISETNYPALWAYQVYCVENGIALSPSKTYSGGWKEFWKENKKGIIIAAVVIVIAVTVTVVIVTTAGTGTNVAVGTGVAAAQAVIDSYNLSEDSDSKMQNLQHEFQIGATDMKTGPITAVEKDSLPLEIPPETLTTLATEWTSNIAPIIEANKPSLLNQDTCANASNLPYEIVPLETTPEISGGSTIIEKARTLGAGAAHEILDAAVTIGSLVPQALEEIGHIGAKIFPESQQLTNFDGESINPEKNYESNINSLHEFIDTIFSTNQASFYTEEAKNGRAQFDVGILPFPGIFNGGIFNVNKLAEAGKTFDKGGLTRAGRGLMKHGYREGSAFPKPLGNPAQINEHGQRVLESILNHPERRLIPGEFERYGKVVDIFAPGIGGARYTANGEFVGFLEP